MIRTTLTSAAIAALCLVGAPATGWSKDGPARPALRVAEAHAAAPDFVGISGWLNSAPLSIASLRGKVVLVDFWTYGCINCVRTLPYVTQLYEKYKDKGLVVVGIHTPEFPFEHSAANVQAALKRHGIRYRSHRTTRRQHGMRIAINTGRRSTSSIAPATSCSPMPAKASMRRSSARSRNCWVRRADRRLVQSAAILRGVHISVMRRIACLALKPDESTLRSTPSS